MTGRRSSRRLTITGSSVFSAKTPVVIAKTLQENVIDENASPQWISAEDAFAFKTPKLSGVVSRRTTLTRQNIFSEDSNEERRFTSVATGNRPPSFFIPFSPPGVKTRSRRSSMHIANQENQLGSGIAKKGKISKTVNRTGKSKDQSATSKIPKKVATKKTKTDSLATFKVPGQKKVGTGKNEDSIIKSSSCDTEVNISTKRVTRRSTIFAQPLNLPVIEEVKSVSPLSTLPGANDSIAAIPSEMLSDGGDVKANENYFENKEMYITPKVTQRRKSVKVGENSMVKHTPDVPLLKSASLAKSASQYRAVKRPSPNKDIFTTPAAKQRFVSPNSNNKMGSPARIGLLKQSASVRKESKMEIFEPELIVTELSQPNTPSRAAPKARKILGVSTPHVNLPASMENEEHSDGEEVFEICDEPPIALCEGEDESSLISNNSANDVSMSHTSSSQWCVIL